MAPHLDGHQARRIRLKPILIAALATVLTTAALPTPPAEGRHTCRARGSTTVFSSRHARIYETRSGHVYGCLYSANRRVLLGRSDCQGVTMGDPEDFRLAGRLVGYATSACNIDQGKDTVRVTDLRTGRKLVVADASPTFAMALPDIGGYFVTDLEVKGNGSVAWITELQASGSPRQYEVRKSDDSVPSSGRIRRESALLDSGGLIAPDSLELSRDRETISWTHAGTPRSAPIQ
ncbi:MAG: hypothetical protein M3133_05895 [Actinomycetota bacterium]|nr:hypothetical protein [Actinomycetota bacterium]